MNDNDTVNESPNNSVIDSDALLESFGGSMEIFEQIVSVYLDSAAEMITAIEGAVEARDHGALQRAAHSYKGAVSNFQAAAATEAARHLEYLGRDEGDWGTVADAFAELVTHANDVEHALRSIQQAARA